MPWDFFFILTVQILIWFVVLGLPIYLLAGAIAGAVIRSAAVTFIRVGTELGKAREAQKGKPIL